MEGFAPVTESIGTPADISQGELNDTDRVSTTVHHLGASILQSTERGARHIGRIFSNLGSSVGSALSDLPMSVWRGFLEIPLIGQGTLGLISMASSLGGILTYEVPDGG